MQLFQFIQSDKQAPVTAFIADRYPGSFFSWLFAQGQLFSDCRVLDLETLDIQAVRSIVEQTFLGQGQLFWLRNISELSSSMRSNIFELLRSYQGPHRLMVFVAQTDKHYIAKSLVRIEIPDELKHAEGLAILTQVGGIDQAYAGSIIQELFSRRAHVEFDQLFYILPYLSLIHHKYIPDFVEHWLDLLVPSESSLFSVSKFFFEKDERAFFIQWSKISEQYSPQFWTVFWSEQLWRASWYVTIARQKKREDLKKIGYRLPFTFVQHGWRSVSLRELKSAHNFIYQLDYATKNGSGTGGLELFFARFFEGKF